MYLLLCALAQASVLSNTSSTLRSKASAMRKASGSDGSNRPFSMALMELRETCTRSASSAWLQPFSARRTRLRFFMSTLPCPSCPFPSHAPLPDRACHAARNQHHEDTQEE